MTEKKLIDECLFVDIFKNIPIDILIEKINAAEALVHLAKNEVYSACLKYVEILSSKTYYDPT